MSQTLNSLLRYFFHSKYIPFLTGEVDYCPVCDGEGELWLPSFYNDKVFRVYRKSAIQWKPYACLCQKEHKEFDSFIHNVFSPDSEMPYLARKFLMTLFLEKHRLNLLSFYKEFLDENISELAKQISKEKISLL